jgi:chemotaxis protein CheD
MLAIGTTFVREFLARDNIPINAHDLLDIHPRKVYFFPKTGRVLVKKLFTLHNDTIATRERDYRQRINETPVEGDVELFT